MRKDSTSEMKGGVKIYRHHAAIGFGRHVVEKIEQIDSSNVGKDVDLLELTISANQRLVHLFFSLFSSLPEHLLSLGDVELPPGEWAEYAISLLWDAARRGTYVRTDLLAILRGHELQREVVCIPLASSSNACMKNGYMNDSTTVNQQLVFKRRDLLGPGYDNPNGSLFFDLDLLPDFASRALERMNLVPAI
ncbi:hypothetical protein N7471_001067 [Penicillium samsonianum]|uniref:uncharacterized protein n=1 Tax=Penicillium samsonianum TaxID=1882272 RepID=UPI0025498F46|nr:uncharacterized protein N7471_001067 [Penicillium samsonianum]KAJ6149868.1 hypothetical protein N7471_001067 [Penicillium samsonianum]